MARSLVMNFKGEESRFDFSKLERRKLYGKRRRIAMDRDGNPCKRASLTEDGQFLIQSGMTAQGYFTDDMRWIPNSDLVGLVDGKPVEKIPSTLGEPQDLEATTAQQLLDLRLSAVYMLTGQSVDAGLQAALDAGEIFTFPFNYRSDFRAETAFIVANKVGTFVLVGTPTTPEWLEPAAAPPIIDDTDEGEDDELDFEMF